MAVGIIFDGVGVSRDQYERVFNEVAPNRERAPGMLTHHAGPTEDGFCVIETWESPEALQQFFTERLGAALARAGIPVQPKVFEIVNSL
jgi:heme-degrading monooxygenase HmoA